MQYLDLLGILQDHPLNSLQHLKKWDNTPDIKYSKAFL